MRILFQIRSWTHRTFFAVIAACVCLLVPLTVQSADITLKWDRSQDSRVAGYKIYCGESGTNFKSRPVLTIDQPSQTTCTISGLKEGVIYGFAATSFDKEGRESRFSEEIYHSIPVAGSSDEERNTADKPNLYRINAGGPQVTLNGKVWGRDEFYSGGRTFRNAAPISGTTDDPIFQTERYGKKFSYRFPVKAGTYTVKLYLSEIYWKDSWKRIFHAKIEKSQGILDFYDIFYEVGRLAADIQTFENIAVTDGHLDIEFTTEVDNAKIAAIEVVPD